MYTNYSISILAFNPAGDGPRAEWTTVKTLEGLPGQPSNLRFTEITMNTLKVEWDDPLKPNGEIVGYLVTYETSEQDESESKEMWKNCFATIFIFICHLHRCKEVHKSTINSIRHSGSGFFSNIRKKSTSP